MSLIPIPDETTPAQRAARQIVNSLNATFDAMLVGHQSIFERLWINPAAAPQEILDALHELLPGGARTLFDLGGLQVQTILTAKPGAMEPAQYMPPRQVAYNEDGSVTVS